MKKLYKWMLVPVFMTLFFSCEQEDWTSSPIIEKEFNITGFVKVYAGDVFNVVITKGDNFSVKAKGPTYDINDMRVVLDANRLTITFANRVQNRPRMDVFITMPTLSGITLSGAATGSVTGFAGQTITIRANLSGAAKCTVNGTGESVQMEVSGASELTLTGTATSLYGNITGGSKVFAYGLNSWETDVTASGGSTAWVKAENILYASASGGSRIYYKGSPTEKHIETSGGGQVIQE
jgi:hypothetical protein